MTKREFAQLVASINWTDHQADSPHAAYKIEFIKETLMKMKKERVIDLLFNVWEAVTLSTQYPDKNSPFKAMKEFKSGEFDNLLTEDFELFDNLEQKYASQSLECDKLLHDNYELKTQNVDYSNRIIELQIKLDQLKQKLSAHVPGSYQTDQMPPRLEERSG
jgi:hypothetical protein